MRVSLSEAKGRLTELVRVAEAGEDVVLTRNGREAVRLTPIRRALDPNARRALIQQVQRSAAASVRPGPDAARSQDFLYGPDGLPE